MIRVEGHSRPRPCSNCAHLGGGFEEILDYLRGLVWAFELASVVRPLDDHEGGVVADRSCEHSPKRCESFVALACEHEHRHGELVQTRPKGFLGSCAAEPQRRCKARCAVSHPGTNESRALREAVKKRPLQPAVKEAFEPSRIARHIVELAREKLVRFHTSLALAVVSDTGSGSDENRSSHHVGLAKRRMQQDPSSERVADVVAFPATLRNELRGLPKVGAHIGRPAMAGKVHCVHEMRCGEDFFELSPSVCVLGESVQEEERRTFTGSLEPELIDPVLAACTAICHER